MDKILVTGGFGFIGSHFIEYLFDKYPDVHIVNVDRKSTGSSVSNIPYKISSSNRYISYIFDITNSEKFGLVCKHHEINAIVNFAAETHVDRSLTDRIGFVHSNVMGVQSILDSVIKYNIPKFLHISTDEVYGEKKPGDLSVETDKFNPTNPYSASKAAAEMLINAARHSFDVNVLVTRSSNNYGPKQFREKLIPKTIYRIKNDIPMTVYNDGSAVREWLYVKANCEAIDLVLHSDIPNETYNIGSGGNEYSVLEIIDFISEIMKKKAKIKFVSDRINDDARYALNMRKTKETFNWRSTYNFLSTLEDTVNWYLEGNI